MAMTVLVAYATKYGSTREVAEAIASPLSAEGVRVEVLPARQVRTLDGYTAVVLGAALHMGRWHADARRFLKRYRAALAHRPVAIFALGPLDTDEKEWQGARAQLDRALAQASWLAPLAVAVFGGVIDPAKLHFPFNHMPAGDMRDWEAIRAWANELGTAFQRVLVAQDAGAAAPAGS